jgi:stage IV sporulation protein FB
LENNNTYTDTNGISYPPKPILVENKQNSLTRSMISLLIYGVLFYILFDQNIAYIAGVLLVLLVHELGHFFAMKLFDYSNVKLFIIPLLGGFVSGKKQEVSQKQLSIILLAGPLPGILIGLVLAFINSLSVSPNETFKMLGNTFLFINLFNLLPVYPLDGGRLLEALFMKQNHLIRLVFGIISIMLLGAFALITFQIILLIVPIMMAFELYNENKNQKIREYLQHENLSYRISYENLTDRVYWLIRDCILFSYPKKYPGIAPGHYDYSFAETLLLQHVNMVLQSNLHLDLGLLRKFFVLFTYLIFLVGAPIAYYLLAR